MTPELWSFSAGLGGAELRAMSVEALDGSVGKVHDVVDRFGGAYLVVNTGHWVFGKTVVLPAGMVRAVDHDRRSVFVDCSREDVRNAPEHDPDAIDEAAREALAAHYGEVRRRDDRAAAGSATEPASDAVPRTEADIASPVPGTAGRTAFGSAEESGEPPAGRPSDALASTQPAQRPAEPESPQADVTPASGRISPALPRERTSSGDTETPSMPAPGASASLGDVASGRTDEARPTRRFARESDRAPRATSRSADRSRSDEGARTSSAQLPIARYDSLTAAEVVARLRNLSQRELASVERHEQRHQARHTVLSRIDSLREDEPWRGYDDATVPEIRRALADADEDRAKAVRDYERRHRDRKGVMEAARRIVASA